MRADHAEPADSSGPHHPARDLTCRVHRNSAFTFRVNVLFMCAPSASRPLNMQRGSLIFLAAGVLGEAPHSEQMATPVCDAPVDGTWCDRSEAC